MTGEVERAGLASEDVLHNMTPFLCDGIRVVIPTDLVMITSADWLEQQIRILADHARQHGWDWISADVLPPSFG